MAKVIAYEVEVSKCITMMFDRKTVVIYKDKAVMVSTIGEQEAPGLIIDGFFGNDRFIPLDDDNTRFYETMLFDVVKDGDSYKCGSAINGEIMEQVCYCDPIDRARKEANRKHDDTVKLVKGMLKSGKL